MTDTGKPDDAPPPKNTILGNVLLPLAWTAYAIYQLARPNHGSALQVVWFGFLAAVGVLLILATLLGRGLPTPIQAAKNVDDMYKGLYAPVHRRRIRIGPD